MGCTTILVGKSASYDGSTMMARNEDASAGSFTPKQFIAVTPEKQPDCYQSVLSGIAIDLPKEPLAYTAVPNADLSKGIWGEAGINAEHVAMTATETITSNPRVLGADPLVKSGIGEEDFLTIVLPYIHSAKEGVERLGALLETYGTYEMNGIGFQDKDEIWWMETIGGHHWMARRVKDGEYVVMPNQQGIESLDFEDAFGEKKENMCSDDLEEFVREHHLDLVPDQRKNGRQLNARAAFGSRDDADHTYNTPRAWTIERYLSRSSAKWDEQDGRFTPVSDDLPWSMVPDRLITPEDIKYVLSDHYQGTPYDPYGHHGDEKNRGKFRTVGINRNNMFALTQIRSGVPEACKDIIWLAMGCNVFNAMVPFYTNVCDTPAYLKNTSSEVSTDNLYWSSRLIAALSDAHFRGTASAIERYQHAVHASAHAMLHAADGKIRDYKENDVCKYLEGYNQEMADMLERKTSELLSQVLYQASLEMKNAFARSDA